MYNKSSAVVRPGEDRTRTGTRRSEIRRLGTNVIERPDRSPLNVPRQLHGTILPDRGCFGVLFTWSTVTGFSHDQSAFVYDPFLPFPSKRFRNANYLKRPRRTHSVLLSVCVRSVLHGRINRRRARNEYAEILLKFPGARLT